MWPFPYILTWICQFSFHRDKQYCFLLPKLHVVHYSISSRCVTSSVSPFHPSLILIPPCQRCNLSLRLTLWSLCAGAKGPLTMGSQQTGNDARRKANVPTAHQNLPSPRCPMTAPPPPLWLSCQMSQVWSTPPLTPAWRTTASQAARRAWPPAAAPRRVSVSGRTDVCVSEFVCGHVPSHLMLPWSYLTAS